VIPQKERSMNTELIPAGTAAVAVPTPNGVAAQLMQVIAANPTAGAENLKALLDGMERVTKWQAEQEFTAAFGRLKFPPIRKTAKGHNSKYAPYEEIQEIIDPILAGEGFTLSYSSGEPNAKGEVPTHGLLSHVGGHSRAGVIYLPPDVTATKSGSTTMNALQSIGSSTSYGMRYVAKMMLNLRFIGDDDDGRLASFISANQIEELKDLIMRSDANEGAFLAIYGAKTLGDLYQVNFRAAKMQLEQKLAKKIEREAK
jgi:hypothetical protein